MRRGVRALLDGKSESGRRPLRRWAGCIRPRNPLRAKTNFASPFNAIPPVQSCREKYSAWRVGQISRIVPRIPPRQEGRIAIVTNVEAGSGGPRDIAACFHADERGLADGQAVWSWRPKAGAKPTMMLRITRATVTTKSGHRGERGVSRQTIAQGRPGGGFKRLSQHFWIWRLR